MPTGCLVYQAERVVHERNGAQHSTRYPTSYYLRAVVNGRHPEESLLCKSRSDRFAMDEQTADVDCHRPTKG
jgi:hypothetical protein